MYNKLVTFHCNSTNFWLLLRTAKEKIPLQKEQLVPIQDEADSSHKTRILFISFRSPIPKSFPNQA